jgi:histidinol phosphatase-like enzyme
MINKAWHEAHIMPRNPTRDQRMQWHTEHSKECNCRKPSPKLLEEMQAWQTAQGSAAKP